MPVVEMYRTLNPGGFRRLENIIIQEQRFEKYYDALKFYKINGCKLENRI